jgi:mRNA interferase HigB
MKEWAPSKGALNITSTWSTLPLTMRIIAKSTLRAFWCCYPDAEAPLLAWYREAEKADWENPAQVKEQYRSASFVGRNRVVFNIKGNDYRLVVQINYPYRVVYVRFVGTHAEYEKIDVREV